ncbi:MAG: adenosylcobinamide-GDP ribazoletransferase [Leptospirillum sp.]
MSCFWGTLSFLTRYPVPRMFLAEEKGPMLCPTIFPVAGILVGMGPATASVLTSHLPDLLDALIVVLVWSIVTGGVHWDGWADSIETALSGVAPQEKERIRKDPHLGTFGVLALVIGVLFKVVAVSAYRFQPVDYVTVALWSRGILPLFLILLRRILPEIPFSQGLGGGMASHLGFGSVATASLVTATLIFWTKGTGGVLVLFAGLVLLLIPARWILTRQDSLSGDFMGFCVELLEISSLIFLGEMALRRSEGSILTL